MENANPMAKHSPAQKVASHADEMPTCSEIIIPGVGPSEYHFPKVASRLHETTTFGLPAPPALAGAARGFGIWGLGSGVWGLASGVWGLGSGVWGMASGVWGLGSGIWGLGSGVW